MNAIEQRARKALSNPRFRELAKLIPKERFGDPSAIEWWLCWAADQDPKGAGTDEYRQARAALSDLIALRALADRAARLYHDPKIQNLAGDKLDWYWQHPEAAMERLAEAARKGELPTNLVHEARLVHEEIHQLSIAEGVADPLDPAAAVPTDDSRSIGDDELDDEPPVESPKADPPAVVKVQPLQPPPAAGRAARADAAKQDGAWDRLVAREAAAERALADGTMSAADFEATRE